MFFSKRNLVSSFLTVLVSFILLSHTNGYAQQEKDSAKTGGEKSVLQSSNEKPAPKTFTSSAQPMSQSKAATDGGDTSGTFAISQDIFRSQPNPSQPLAKAPAPQFKPLPVNQQQNQQGVLPKAPTRNETNQNPKGGLAPLTFNDLRTSGTKTPSVSSAPKFQDSAGGVDAAPLPPKFGNGQAKTASSFSFGDENRRTQQQPDVSSRLSHNAGPQASNPGNLRPPVQQSPSTGVVRTQFQEPVPSRAAGGQSFGGQKFGGGQPLSNGRAREGFDGANRPLHRPLQPNRNAPPRMANRNASIVPAAPVVAKEPVISMRTTKDLFTRFEIKNAPDPLPGKPTKLVDMLRSTTTNKRGPMVTQYWMTYYDWTRLHNSVAALKFLNQVPAPRSQSDRVLLNAARSSAENRVLADEIQLGKSQSKLHQFVTINRDELPPLPSDKPLLSKYNSHYDWYASRNLMPARLKGIHQVLPKSLQLISNRADTVKTANSALNQTKTAYATGQTNLATVLEALRLWRDAEQNLVASVVSYNQAIADYSLTLSGNSKSAKQVADMLIAKPKANVLRSTPVPDRSGFAGQSRGAPRVASQDGRFGQVPSRTFDNRPSRPAPANSPPALDSGGFKQPIRNPFGNPGAGAQPSKFAPTNPSTARPPAQPEGGGSFGGGGFGK